MISTIKKDKQILVTVLWTFMARGIAAFGTILLSLVLARYANSSELGLFMIGLSLIVGLGILSRFGMDNAMLRFGGVAVQKNDLANFNGLQRQALTVAILLSLTISIIMIYGAEFIAIQVFRNNKLIDLMYPMALVLPPYSLIYLQGTWLKVLKRPSYAPLFETGTVSFLTALGIVLYDSLGYSVTSISAAYLLFISTIIVLVFGQLVVIQVKKYIFNKEVGFVIYEKKILKVLPDFLLIGLTAYSVQWGTFLILGAFVDSSLVGIYSTAYRIAAIVTFILMVFNTVLAPKFASYYFSGDYIGLKSIAQRSTFYMTIFALPVALIIVVFSSYILLLFGADFQDWQSLLVILSVAQFINVATGPVGFLLNMTGHQTEMRRIVLFTGVLAVSLSLLLVPSFSLWGALIANSSALIIQNVLAAYQVNKILKIKTIPGWQQLSDRYLLNI